MRCKERRLKQRRRTVLTTRSGRKPTPSHLFSSTGKGCFERGMEGWCLSYTESHRHNNYYVVPSDDDHHDRSAHNNQQIGHQPQSSASNASYKNRKE